MAERAEPDATFAQAITPPTRARTTLARLTGRRDEIAAERARAAERLASIRASLELAPKVEAALDQLSERMFGHIVATIQDKMTLALQEVLEQPLTLRVLQDFKRSSVSLSFTVERDGEPEDILRGQGGSVANVLSVGLRLLALTTLDDTRHRRVLILDEPDCWLRPDLVPRLVKIIAQAGRQLGFQVLLISHHETRLFESQADAIITFEPTGGGVRVRRRAEPRKAENFGDESDE